MPLALHACAEGPSDTWLRAALRSLRCAIFSSTDEVSFSISTDAQCYINIYIHDDNGVQTKQVLFSDTATRSALYRLRFKSRFKSTSGGRFFQNGSLQLATMALWRSIWSPHYRGSLVLRLGALSHVLRVQRLGCLDDSSSFYGSFIIRSIRCFYIFQYTHVHSAVVWCVLLNVTKRRNGGNRWCVRWCDDGQSWRAVQSCCTSVPECFPAKVWLRLLR